MFDFVFVVQEVLFRIVRILSIHDRLDKPFRILIGVFQLRNVRIAVSLATDAENDVHGYSG